MPVLSSPPVMLTLQLRLGIDDPLDSSAVHLVNGVLGMLLLSFVARPSHVDLLVGSPCAGIFYTRTGWLLLGVQVLGEYSLLNETAKHRHVLK